jgi:hypothetical protein
MLALLALVTLVFAQATTPIAPSPFDEVHELELSEEDEALVEARGPAQLVELEVEFEGTLHIWTTSELDLFLRVEDADDSELLAEDDNSGGGVTPYLRLEVSEGDVVAVIVAGLEGALGSAALHLIAAPETKATREAAAAVTQALSEAARLKSEGDFAGPRELLRTALDAPGNTEGQQHSQGIADALWAGGFAAYNVGSTDTCFGAWSRARAHRERTLPADHPDLLSARSNLANLLEAMGDLAGARVLQEAVLAGYERTLPADHPFLLGARHNLASSMWAMGDLAGARALREAVLAARERTQPADHPDLLGARANLAVSMQTMGDLSGARVLQEAVLAGYERTLPADHPYLLSARNNLASSMWAMGDLAGARALQEAVLAGYERTLPADHPQLLRTRNNLANSMWAMGDLADARALQEAVLAGYERTLPADQPFLLGARANLANSMQSMGDLAGARALLEAVLAGYERTLPADHPDLLSARNNLANSMQTMGDLGGARALQEAVLAARERTQPADHPDLLLARAGLALSMYAMGDLAGARALLPALCAGMRARILASLALAPRQVRQTVGSEDPRLASAYFLSESADSRLQSVVFELTETMRAVAGEAARSLAQADGDPELAHLFEQADEVRRTLNNLIAGTGSDEVDSDAISDEVARLSFERDRLERAASRLLAERGVVTQPVEIKELVSALEAQEAIVGYRRLPHWYKNEESGLLEVGIDHLLAHVLRPDGTLTRVDLGPAEELEGLASAWRAALGAPLLRGVALEKDAENAEAIAGARLRERILDPILEVAGDDVQRLFVCADDLVFLLPIDALPLDDEGAERVGDQMSIISEVSFARLMVPQLATSSAPSLLSLGGVDYDAEGAAAQGVVAASAPIFEETSISVEDETPEGDASESRGTRSGMSASFRKLPQSRREAEATADVFEEAFEVEPVLLTREDTTKATLFEAASGKRYVHLATHGWFAPESVRSTEDASSQSGSFMRMSAEERVAGLAPMTLCGLAMAGANHGRDSLGRVTGILTAEELCSLDLSHCELAVLSACETNVGIRRAGQGIQSLQAALYAAGARTSITSLWKVDDAATRDLMETFYSNLWLEGMGKAEALWQAKKALRDGGDPPANWAGWVLTGDPD